MAHSLDTPEVPYERVIAAGRQPSAAERHAAAANQTDADQLALKEALNTKIPATGDTSGTVDWLMDTERRRMLREALQG